MTAGAPLAGDVRPLPEPTEETRPFWDGTKRGELLLQSCQRCERLQFYPRILCAACGSTQLAWQKSSGRGVIYSFTVSRRPASPAFEALVPYIVAVIELDEGVRMLSNVVHCDVDRVRIGQSVEVDFLAVTEEISLPVFLVQGV